ILWSRRRTSQFEIFDWFVGTYYSLRSSTSLMHLIGFTLLKTVPTCCEAVNPSFSEWCMAGGLRKMSNFNVLAPARRLYTERFGRAHRRSLIECAHLPWACRRPRRASVYPEFID